MRTDNKSQQPTLTEAIQVVIDANLIDVHVCLPGKIVDYDSSTQYASVEIQLQKQYEDGTVVSWPVIANVPVKHPRANGGKTYIHIGLVKDDDVMLVFSERSLDNWKTQGGMQNPNDRRKFNITDAYALIGGSAIPDAFEVNDPQAIEIQNKSGKMQIKQDGTINLGDFAPTHAVGLADKITDHLTAIENKLSSFISDYNVHMHPTAAIGPPSPPLVPESPFTPDTGVIGSTKVKVVT